MEEDSSNKKVVIGVKQSLRAIEADRVTKVIIASDAEDKVIRNVKILCKRKGIVMESADSMKMLGKKYGISVGASVVAMLKK